MSSRIIGIDAGNNHSALVVYAPQCPKILDYALESNEDIAMRLKALRNENTGGSGPNRTRLVLEMVKSYGSPLGDSILETVFWIGRFVQIWTDTANMSYDLVPRKTIVNALIGHSQGGDSAVRQSLINYFANRGLYGPQGESFEAGSDPKSLTRKGGPLYGIKKDLWAALAVCVSYRTVLEKRHHDIL